MTNNNNEKGSLRERGSRTNHTTTTATTLGGSTKGSLGTISNHNMVTLLGILHPCCSSTTPRWSSAVTLSFLIFLVVSVMAEISASTNNDYYDTTYSSSSGNMRRRGIQEQHQPTLVARSEHSSRISSSNIASLGEQVAKTMQDSMEALTTLALPRELQPKLGTMLVHQGDMVVQLGQAGDAVEYLISKNTLGRTQTDPTMMTVENEHPAETRIMMGGSEGGEDDRRGFIEEKSIGYRGNMVDETLSLKLRIPSKHFFEFVSALEALVEEYNKNNKSSSYWKIQHYTTSSRDVTEQYVDATARADVLEASRSSIQSLLVHANSVQDVLAIQQELNRLTEAQESQRQRALTLQKQSVGGYTNIHSNTFTCTHTYD
jgi:Domain of unknown function (DUF4349)